jgi:hypothetical protein
MKLNFGIWFAISLLAMMLSAPATVAQSIEVAGASVTATNDLLVFFWLAEKRSLADAVDVSSVTKQKITGSVVRWRVKGPQFDLERVAGVDPGGHLLVFSWSTKAESVEDWHFVDVSAVISGGQTLTTGPITTWQTPDGPFLVDHIAGVSPSGDLVVFFWSTQADSEKDWNVVNVSALTQRNVVGPLTSWQTQEGRFKIEHVAVASPDGDLLVFSWSPATDWQVLNASGRLPIGIRPSISGPLTSWQTRIRLFLFGTSTVEHVAGASPNGDLLVFSRNVGLDLALNRPPTWQHVNVSNATQQNVAALMDSWVGNGDELITAVGTDDHLYVFWSLALDHPDTRWGYCDIAKVSCTSRPR